MPKVYLINPTGGNIIGLDCEKSITVSRTNTLTSKSVMSGKDISDGYHAGLKSVAVNGLVTYSKGVGQQDTLNPIEFQRALDKIIDDKQRFTLYSEKSIELLDDIEDCIIESVVVTLNRFLNAIEIDLVIREVWISQAAEVGGAKLPPQKSEGAAKDGSNPTSGRGGKTETEEKENLTIFRGIEEDGRSLLGIQSGL